MAGMPNYKLVFDALPEQPIQISKLYFHIL